MSVLCRLRANFKPKKPGVERLQYLDRSWSPSGDWCWDMSLAVQGGVEGTCKADKNPSLSRFLH